MVHSDTPEDSLHVLSLCSMHCREQMPWSLPLNNASANGRSLPCSQILIGEDPSSHSCRNQSGIPFEHRILKPQV